MSFKIRPVHERIFANPTQQRVENNDTENTDDNLVEDSVFVIDEETGEIHEEKQYIEQVKQPTSQVPVTVLPRKESARIQALSMKKRTKVSFM